MEYLVNISKKVCILELQRRHLKITVLTSYAAYPSRKIHHICACTSLKTTKETRFNTSYLEKTNTPLSFDESDDEDYTVIFDQNSFSYKIISAKDLKMDSKNVNEKVNIPSFPSPEPKNRIIIVCNLCTDLVDFTDMALPPRDQRHQYLRYERLQYTDADIVNFETRLGKIYKREVHRVHVFDFGGLTDPLAEGLSSKMLMEHRDAQGQGVLISQAWRRLFEIRGMLVHELILEFFSTFRFGKTVLHLDMTKASKFHAYWAESARQIANKGDLSAYWVRISFAGDFLGTPPFYTLIRDPMLRSCHRLIACSTVGRSQAPVKVIITNLFYLRGMDVELVNIPYMLARYLRLLASGRKQGTMISRGQFVARLVAVVGAPEAIKDAPVANVGALAIPAPVQAPQPPHPVVGPARTMTQRLARVEYDVHEIRGALGV
uniref:Uncharacterized protein n=1 Tax=Tanacetum cinerariifolium TaxID=118510 RepID=A0A6L2M3B7_TANCI|nr:hypothetical protein [Tanacetum cinerariifolium]